MNNFWKSKPLKVTNNTKQSFRTLLQKEMLLSRIAKDICSSTIDLMYCVLDMTDEDIGNTLAFINVNYTSNGSSIALRYSKDLYAYYCDRNSICIGFYPKKTTNSSVSNKMVGFIMGKPINVFVKGERIDTLEVNFLCLIPQLRSLHVSSYMVSILSKVCLKRTNIVSAVYTVGKQLATESFSKKHYYHRPLDIMKMVATGLICESYLSQVAKRMYSTFNYKRNIKHLWYYHNRTDVGVPMVDELVKKIITYNQKTFKIFDLKSQSRIAEMFQNSAFHKFVFKDEDGRVTDFVSMYHLDTVDVNCDISCRNGYIYCYFFNDDATSYKFDIIERISEYCAINDLFDMITVMDCFGLTEREYHVNKFMRGSGKLYYYFYNVEMFKVQPEHNGLVTI